MDAKASAATFAGQHLQLNPMDCTLHCDTRSGFRFLRFNGRGEAASASAVVYLHGAGERGDDPSLVTRYGLPAMLAEGRATVNCTVYCPQLEADQIWEPGRIKRFLGSVGEGFGAITLIGFSLGACGVCNLLAEHGAVVNFAMAIAGQGPARAEVSQVGVRLLAVQGELDTWPDTRQFLQSVRSAGGNAVDVQMPGQGHFISELALWHPVAIDMLQASGVIISPTHSA